MQWITSDTLHSGSVIQLCPPAPGLVSAPDGSTPPSTEPSAEPSAELGALSPQGLIGTVGILAAVAFPGGGVVTSLAISGA